MDNPTRRNILQEYRRQREATNLNPVGEATGRTYIPIPDELIEIGKNSNGINGFINLLRRTLHYSPLIIREWELIVGDYFFLLPYELVPMDLDLDYEGYVQKGALPVIPMGHTAVNAEKGLKLGWNGILQLIKENRAKYLDGSAEAEFLEGEIQVVQMIQDRIRAYGKLAVHLAEAADSSEQKQEYNDIADRCFRLAGEPPRTFHDALQWYFFYVIFERLTSTGMGSVRVDQVFYPFYRNDISAGRLDEDRAQMLLECMFMKEPLFWSIGGVTPCGEDATNELSFLVLKAYDAVGGTSNLSFRWHPQINPRLFEKVTEILARHGTGVPSVVNDDVIIPSLVEYKFPIEQARNYVFGGCFWWTVPGNEYTYHDLAGFSGLRVLMRVLAEGGKAGWQSFEDLWNAFAERLDEGIRALLEAYQLIDRWLPKKFPEMVVSLLMDGCLEKGRAYNDRGPERNMMTVIFVGLANIANSLVAIKKHLYENQTVRYEDLLLALEANFSGYESLLMLLKKSPKYGNGNEEADQMAVRVAELFKACLKKYRNSKGDLLRPAFYSWHRQTFEGSVLGASPDGRLRGQPLAYAGNPSPGTSKQGLTAAIQSMTRINYRDTAGGPIFLLLQREKDHNLMVQTIQSLLLSSLQLGAPHIILNLADSSILKDAIDHPENYPDLVVRVTGYSAIFTQLERQYQLEIASRNSY